MIDETEHEKSIENKTVEYKNLGEQAFANIAKVTHLKDDRKVVIKYSAHFKNYNSNAKYNTFKIQFNLSKQWKIVDEDIQLGLIESLIVRIYKIKNVKTPNMELYESFMKNLSKYAKKHTHEPLLEESFHRINEKFFNGMMDKPNMVWANESFAKLGSYEYGTDTIYISTIFQNLPVDEIKYLDYIIYHELLHKKHSFNIKNGRHQAHTTAFRVDEAKFGVDIEKELGSWLRKKKYSIKKLFGFW